MTLLLGAVAAFVIAALTAPVGVSGAVFLMPVQLSVLHTPTAAVTATNLLYNLVAIPGGLLRYSAHGAIQWSLATVLVLGTIPGTVVGACVRIWWLSGPNAFLLVVAAVLIPLGCLLLSGRVAKKRAGTDVQGRQRMLITLLAAVVGFIGGIYGIGGGSLLAPILVGMGYGVTQVAPAALASTLVTSVAGLATFVIAGVMQGHPVGPNWALGAAMGLGGFMGSYAGAALQPWLPEQWLRSMLGAAGVAVGSFYVWKVLG